MKGSITDSVKNNRIEIHSLVLRISTKIKFIYSIQSLSYQMCTIDMITLNIKSQFKIQ